jgi:hypothetical protein
VRLVIVVGPDPDLAGVARGVAEDCSGLERGGTEERRGGRGEKKWRQGEEERG